MDDEILCIMHKNPIIYKVIMRNCEVKKRRKKVATYFVVVLTLLTLIAICKDWKWFFPVHGSKLYGIRTFTIVWFAQDALSNMNKQDIKYVNALIKI